MRLTLVTVGASALLLAEAPAQSKQEHQSSGGKSDSSLQDQLSELRAEVTRLQAALAADHQGASIGGGRTSAHGSSSGPSQEGGMQGNEMKNGMNMDMGMMGMMKGMEMGMMKGMDMGMNKGMGMQMGGMSMGSDGKKMGMSMMKRGMGMGQMSKMGKAPDSALEVSALPGFPGASHLYHIGATGFFLDHLEHLNLTKEQQDKLNRIKEKALLEQREFEREIEKTEEEIWSQTGADTPDVTEIAENIRRVGDLSVEQRLAFIREIGAAANILTNEQRKILGGTLDPPKDDAHKH